jgi:putative glutathione S-transferase
MLIDGQWNKSDRDLFREDGSFKRPPSTVRERVGDPGLPVEPGRYHLYLSEGCPWAHRVRLLLHTLGLGHAISSSYVTNAPSPADGWGFDEVGRYRDVLFGARTLHEVYARTHPGFTGRATVPILVDKVTGRMVNNESADIVEMLAGPFLALADRPVELLPDAHRAEIDALNARIYGTLNNGVYKAGFAQSDSAHEAALDEVFATLDFLEAHLEDRRYLCGGQLTLADWRLFPTLHRFDAAYVPVFGCDRRPLSSYPRLSAYLERLRALPGVDETLLPLDLYRRGYGSIPFAWANRGKRAA